MLGSWVGVFKALLGEQRVPCIADSPLSPTIHSGRTKTVPAVSLFFFFEVEKTQQPTRGRERRVWVGGSV